MRGVQDRPEEPVQEIRSEDQKDFKIIDTYDNYSRVSWESNQEMDMIMDAKIAGWRKIMEQSSLISHDLPLNTYSFTSVLYR